ncbi:hypothetical protein [Burkholderia gladioli]|uniref:hypothetical protein n=1 Tax=Burkholderia gladioli TaxID=28095 RepID=UPI00163F1AC3|nr:hypothetical protein [Burkholderia gladioli]
MTPRQKPMASKLGRPVSFDRDEVLEQAMRVFWGGLSSVRRASVQARSVVGQYIIEHDRIDLSNSPFTLARR